MIAKVRGLARCQTYAGGACSSPERKQTPKVSLQGRNTAAPNRGPFHREWRPARDRVPELPIPGHLCAHYPEPARVQLQSASTGAEPGPWALQKPQLVHRCSLHRVTWGRGGDAAETGTLLPLSPPAPPELSLRLRLLCGTRSAGPRSRLPSAPLTATMPPSALRSAVTLPPPPAAPHATAERWSRQGGARRDRALSAGSPGQSQRQDRSLGGSRLEGPGRARPSSARVLKPRPGAARAERWPARSRGQGGSALCAACGGKTLERAEGGQTGTND